MMSFLVAEWADDVTALDIYNALFGGDCPTDGITWYTIHGDARTIRIEGTRPESVDAVWDFLTDLHLLAEWPEFRKEATA